jgi:hypothetical protein
MKFDKLMSIIENTNICDAIAENIKKYLLEYYDYDTWGDFVQKQEVGDCQVLCSNLNTKFPVKSVFGEIEIDHEYIDDNGDVQNLVTHHWLLCNNIIIDVSKGTLKNNIEWEDINSVFVSNEESKRYRPIRVKNDIFDGSKSI